ncbi:MAG: hypothetical protein Q8P67_29210, partial [archaeon]|nr:hypothetical protein [archaeon]
PFSRFSPLQYQLSPLACSRDPSAPSHPPFLAPLALHWASSIEESTFILQPSETTSFRFHSDSGSSAAHILLIADPDCSYRLVLWRDLPGFCGQVWRSYSPALLSCTTVLCVITFLFGISRAETSSSLFSFSHSLKAACASSVVVIGLLLPTIDFCLGLFSASHLSIWPLLFPEQMGSPPHRAIPPFVLCVLVSISVAILFVLHCLFLIVTSCLSLLGRFISPESLTSSALRVAVVSILATVLFHPSLGTIVALSHLLLLSALFPSGRSAVVVHHLESLFFLYFLPLLLLFPGLVVWGKNLAFLPFFNLIRLDFETLFAVICALHVYQTVACSSADLPTYRSFFAVWFAIVAAFFTPMCLVHIHHCLDLASVLGASFVFYDLSRIRNLNHPKKSS